MGVTRSDNSDSRQRKALQSLRTATKASEGALQGMVDEIAQINSDLAGKSDVGHTHPQSQVSNLISDLASKQGLLYSLTAIRSQVANGGSYPTANVWHTIQFTTIINDIPNHTPTLSGGGFYMPAGSYLCVGQSWADSIGMATGVIGYWDGSVVQPLLYSPWQDTAKQPLRIFAGHINLGTNAYLYHQINGTSPNAFTSAFGMSMGFATRYAEFVFYKLG